jgi:diguanylate cyclase (GGDEF)-like protein
MIYTGRILAVILAVGFSTVNYLYRFLALDTFWSWIVSLILILLAWWFGSQYDKAKTLAIKDTLSGLYNRRFIDELFPKLLSQAQRKGEKVIVMMIDCNDFKIINDTYGHKTGDQVLKNISKILLENTRTSDVVARWGGDEFLGIFPNTDKTGIGVVIQRFEKRIQALSDRNPFNVSISVGISVFPDDSNDFHDLIKIADDHMYKVKAETKLKTKS